MYLLFDQDGDVTRVDFLPDNVSYDCWPTVVKVDFENMEVSRMAEDGWQKLTND